MKWVIWWIWLCEPYGKVPMVSRRCPYESDLRWVIWSNPIKMIRIDEKWMNRVNRGEMSDLMEMTWNNPMGKSLWSIEGVPIKMTWMNPMRMSLSKWMESMRNKWNEVNRGEMSEWMELTWNNPMGISLWSEEGVPMRMTWCEWKWVSLSKWSESMRFELE